MKANNVVSVILASCLFLFPHSSHTPAKSAKEIEYTVPADTTGFFLPELPAAVGGSALAASIETVKQHEELNGSVTGISIRKGNTGEIIYSSMGNIRLHPASNMKLLTAAAALRTLGPEYRFSTELWTDGKIMNGVLHGNIFLKGKGDPTLLKEDLDLLAKKLKEKGVSRIEGDVAGDDSWYDDVRLSQDLNWSDESSYTGAQVSALTLSPDSDYDTGTVLIEIYPGTKPGKPAQIKMIPENDYVEIINKTETVNENGSRKLSIEREHGANRIIVKGEIPLEGKKEKTGLPFGNLPDIR